MACWNGRLPSSGQDSISYTNLLSEKIESLDGQEGSEQDTASDIDSSRMRIVHRACTGVKTTFALWTVTMLSISLSVFLFLRREKSQHFSPSYAKGFVTDFEDVRSSIAVHQVQFTGSPQYNSSGHMYVVPSDGPLYVGQPTPEIDEAWQHAIENRYFHISEEEAISSWGDKYGDLSELYDPNKSAYIAGLDMFHTLHCLNRLRKEFDVDYYKLPPLHRIHRDHCIDHIRQQIMCTGDLTPVPTRYFASIGHTYADSNVHHTCRDFWQVRQWVTERWNLGH